MEVITSVLLMGGFKAISAIVAVLGARAALLWFDKSKFGESFQARLEEWDAHSQALYFGLRFAGVCVLVGLVFS